MVKEQDCYGTRNECPDVDTEETCPITCPDLNMVIPTEEEFFVSVDNWIHYLTGEGKTKLIQYNRFYSCGFCAALEGRVKIDCRQDDACISHCLIFELCEGAYNVWVQERDRVVKEQAILEILEGLWKIGLKLGYFKE